MDRRRFVASGGMLLLGAAVQAPVRSAEKEGRFLYAAEPGIRNYVEFGGVGVLVFDRDHNHRCVRRIPTWPEGSPEGMENVKGICASAKTGKLYVSTIKRLLCLDLLTEKPIWEQTYEGGCDRMSLSPDGKLLYVPSLEGPHWHAVNAADGSVLAKIVPNSKSHNTVYGPDGREVYLAGLGSPYLSIADPKTHTVARQVGPFSAAIRPFTVNGAQTLCFVNVNELLGFEIGDLKSGKKLHRVEVQGFEMGPVKRHGCPSHGVGLTPDEKELWVVDGHNERVHIFDATRMPPKQGPSIKLREQPGWVTFSLDGKLAYLSTGEVIDTRTKKIVAALSDEQGRQAHSEKVLEIIWKDGKPAQAGDQFGLGRKA